jgi:hypothetical protein
MENGGARCGVSWSEGMVVYKKLSDTWRDENASKTFAGFATFARVQGHNSSAELPAAEIEKSDSGAAKAAKAAKVGTSEAAAEPSLAYESVSADPSGATCSVRIIELPQAQRYRRTFAALQTKCPALVPINRWRQCVEDGRCFLAKWGEQAEALAWTAADLFGLHTPPSKPHPSYSRLSRYDCTGLVWLLQGLPVVALTADTASIRHPTGNITVYRKHNKPALGPVGDCWRI